MKKKKVVVSRDSTPDWPKWLEKQGKIQAEIWRQLILGLKNPGSGLTLDQLQAVVEHRNPFLKKAEAAALIPFKYDKAKDGWKLLEDVQPSGEFVPDFVPFLKSGETSINGDEMRSRAKELNANLGQRDLEWLEVNQHLIPESERGHYLVASGTVWQDSRGHRGVPYLRWLGFRWYLCFYWLEHDWYGDDRLVSLRK